MHSGYEVHNIIYFDEFFDTKFQFFSIHEPTLISSSKQTIWNFEKNRIVEKVQKSRIFE